MNNKEKLLNEIIKSMSESNLDLYDLVEVLANIFIRQGIQYTDINSNANLNKLNLANEIVKDIERNGQTLPNSLVRQGLLILSWLESKEKQ
tara:strand:+ start:11351 stop:11623 length:273 start_codon:yes stop_codon:yes gene_type:complete